MFSETFITAAGLLARLKTVDGAGSGLHADLLDGQHGAYYASQAALDAHADLAAGDGVHGIGPFGAELLGDADANEARTTLELGSAAVLNADNSPGHLPVLDGGGQLSSSVLPPLAISDPFVVANEAAMLALTAERGDIAIRTDNGRSYILSSNDPATLADWVEVRAAGAVTSVNTYTGNVVLVKGDVGLGSADNTSDANKPVSTATQTALDAKAFRSVIETYGEKILGDGSATAVYAATSGWTTPTHATGGDLAITLPAAGTYEIQSLVSGSVTGAAYGTLIAKLYDVTNAADVPATEMLVVLTYSAAPTWGTASHAPVRIAVAAPTVVALQVQLQNSATAGTVESYTGGRVRMTYRRIV